MKKPFFLTCFLFFSCLGYSQPVMTLAGIMEAIEKNNPLLQSYASCVDADKAMIGSANAWSPPKAGVEFDANPYSFDNFYSGIIRTSVSQDFPNRRATNAKKEYLSSLSQINVNESMSEKNALFTEAKKAYYAIFISQKKISLTKDNMTLLKSMIDLSEKQMATGKEELATVFKLKARLSEKQAMLIHEENMISANLTTLNYLMNSDVSNSFVIDTNNIVKDYRKLYVFTKDSIAAKRSDVLQMNSMANAMSLNRDVIASRSRPVFGMKFEHFTIPNLPDKFSLMGTMTIPFAPWSARAYKSEEKAVGFKITAIEQERENLLNMAAQKVRMMEIEMNSEYRELDNYSQQVIPAYKKSMDAYLLAYGQNTSSLVMVLMAYDDLQMAQMEYIKHFETLLKVQVDYENELQVR